MRNKRKEVMLSSSPMCMIIHPYRTWQPTHRDEYISILSEEIEEESKQMWATEHN